MPQLFTHNVGMPSGAQNHNVSLPIASAPTMPMNYYPAQTNHIVVAPISPVMSIPNSVATPSQALL